ncbi:MAG: FCD domain-containing protein [Thermotogota bacterium]
MTNQGSQVSSGTTPVPPFLRPAAPIGESKKSVTAFKYIVQLLESTVPKAKLPSERDIADALGMTRSPVHEALVALRMAGRIRIVPGVGAYPVAAEEKKVEEGSGLLFLAESESPHEVFQLRVVVEEVILRTLVPELTPGKAAQIDLAFRRLADAMNRGGIEAYLEANRVFHMSLAVATGNTLLAKLEYWMLYQVMTERLWREVLDSRLREMGDDVARVVQSLIEEHQQILLAIRSQDTERAVRLMLQHVGRIEADVEAPETKRIGEE